jgi:hypothetical protein
MGNKYKGLDSKYLLVRSGCWVSSDKIIWAKEPSQPILLIAEIRDLTSFYKNQGLDSVAT